MSFRVVIPARYGSERLPGKPLADIHGKPMIVHVAQAASRSGAAEVVVATDDARILEAVQDHGFSAELTRTDHPSGSDRVMEVASLRQWSDDDIVLNVQGDEPLIPPEVLDQLAETLIASPSLHSATLCERITRMEDLLDPNLVKVVRTEDERALYFSRAPVPYDRDHFPNAARDLTSLGDWWRHIGVYGFRVAALAQFVRLPMGKLEKVEKLEQLRLLENGLAMAVKEACRPVPGGVDTDGDLARVRSLLG